MSNYISTTSLALARETEGEESEARRRKNREQQVKGKMAGDVKRRRSASALVEEDDRGVQERAASSVYDAMRASRKAEKARESGERNGNKSTINTPSNAVVW